MGSSDDSLTGYVAIPDTRARLLVTPELLVDVLGLPANTEIHGCGPSATHQYIEIVVSHPDLPRVKDGQVPPTVTARFKRQDPVVFEGWEILDA